MASIDNLMMEHFAPIGAEISAQLVVGEMDNLVFKIGKMSEAIYDYMHRPLDDIDNETIISMATALISLVGRTGPFIDALETFAFNIDGIDTVKSH